MSEAKGNSNELYERSNPVSITTGTRYKVRADGDGSVHVSFTATLVSVEFDGPSFAWLSFDNGVSLWTFNEAVTFEMEPVE